MSSVNKVIIVGRLGNDPEVRQFQNGGGVTNISVATSERWTDKYTGERKEQTEWHRISLFNRLGEIAAQYLRKGSMVYIEGSLQTRKYTDQQGIERYSTEIRASEMRMLSSNNEQGGGYGNQGGNYGNNFGGYQTRITNNGVITRTAVLIKTKAISRVKVLMIIIRAVKTALVVIKVVTSVKTRTRKFKWLCWPSPRPVA